MLRYRLEGSGSPLLLIHGWGVTYAIWQNLAPFLTNFQLIMIELPGIGGSPDVDPQKPYYQACAEAIEEVRQFLGIERWAIFSYSSGTRAAEAYIQRYPGSISRAIFLCPIYLLEIWSIFVRLLGTPYPLTLRRWIFSDWRLYSLVLALGFNGHRHDYTNVWKDEIELQSINTLVRSLYEMPGKGRAPFSTPEVPTLFVWGQQDALTARPRHPRPNDVMIHANHSAPMLAAASVAEVVVPFLVEGKFVATSGRQTRWRYMAAKGVTIKKERKQLRSLLHSHAHRRVLLRPRPLLKRIRKPLKQLQKAKKS